jgi:DNA repair exonuclease SbcCD nuclease subunit
MTTPFKKLATITDIHFGRNSNSPVANQDNLDFIDWFVEEARTFGATEIAILGDFFDNRNSLHISTLDAGLRGLEKLNAAFEKIHFIVGNHDLLYRDRRDVTSTSFAKHLTNINLITKPVTFGEGRNGVTFLPWLVGDEHKKLKNLKSRYIFGHLELPGYLMNARVEMPCHGNGLTSDDFKGGAEYVFSGHFHFRQAKDNVVYTGNIMPFNFADSWDEDRGMMFLEWGKEPQFKAWADQPTYRTMKLSELLQTPEKVLKSKVTARVTLDMDISYEEAQVIRDEYAKMYGVRKIELIHQSKASVADQDFTKPVAFQSVDQIVIEGLMSIAQDGKLNRELLVDIYRSLPAL